MTRKKNKTVQIVLLVVAYLVFFALLFSVLKPTTDKPAEKPSVNQPGTNAPGQDQPGTDVPVSFYLIVNGQKVVDQCMVDLSKDLNVQVVSEVDKFDYAICSNITPQDKAFMFTAGELPYIFLVNEKGDYSSAFTIAVNGKNLTVLATTLSQVLIKKHNATTFSYDEKKTPIESFPYFVLEVTSGTKTISVLLTMPK